MCEFMGMRKGIEVRLGAGDRERLAAVIGSGNSRQKHVWRGPIGLLRGGGPRRTALQRPARKGQAENLAWAGAVYGRGGRWAAARRDAAGTQEAAAGGDRRGGGRDDVGRTAGRGGALA